MVMIFFKFIQTTLHFFKTFAYSYPLFSESKTYGATFVVKYKSSLRQSEKHIHALAEELPTRDADLDRRLSGQESSSRPSVSPQHVLAGRTELCVGRFHDQPDRHPPAPLTTLHLGEH